MSGGAGLRSPLGRAVGLGSAKEGVSHWWAQRLGSLALVPLGLWFVASVIALAGTPHAEFVACQTALTVMLGLERAFQVFGGVPQHVLFDQMKSVIVEDHRPGGAPSAPSAAVEMRRAS